MAKAAEVEKLRFLGLDEERQTAKLEALREAIVEDEDFRWARIKLDNKKPRYELPAPTKKDPDNTELTSEFYGVVCLARKNFYQSDEDKEKGLDPKEKRELYVLRLGRYVPEQFFVSPTGVAKWKLACKDVMTEFGDEVPYYGVLFKVTAEQIKGKQNTWSKPTFTIERKLTKDEIAHIEELRAIIGERVKQYVEQSELDDYEEKAMSVDKGRRDDDEDEIDEKDRSGRDRRARRAEIEDEDDDTPAAPAKGSKSKKSEDDEDEKPSKSKKSKDEDEDDEKPSKSKKSKASEDDDDDDEKPSKSAKSRKAEDDDEDDEKPAKGGRRAYPSLDEDED